MNNKAGSELDYRSLLVLEEISRDDALTQQELSKRLGIAVGLTNSYIKNLISKGYVTVAAIPRRRYRYYLTPKGFVEKTRLTFQHIENFTNLYRLARRDFGVFFRALVRDSGVRKVALCGTDEVAEIACLSLKEAGLELTGVVDREKTGSRFFGHRVSPLEEAAGIKCDLIVITSFKDGLSLFERLLECGVSRSKVCDLSRDGWLKKVAGGR